SLSSSGTISGTPTAAGTANFTVRVSDSASASTTRALTLTVSAAATLPDMQQMAIWTEFVDRHEALVGPGGGTDNGGFYGLAGTDAGTVNSLIDSAQQQLAQIQTQS